MTRGMRLLAIAVALLLFAAPARAQWKSVEAVEIKGAYGLIIVPENWNGGLFIYAHGYSADQRIIAPFPSDLTPGNVLNEVGTLFQASIIGAKRVRVGHHHLSVGRLVREGLDQGHRICAATS
jgi:hypothetical protein